MAIGDKVLGASMIFAAIFIFSYYTIWAILLPLLDDSNTLHDFFPSREWAVRIPAFFFVVGLAGVGSFIGSTILNENRKTARTHQRTA